MLGDFLGGGEFVHFFVGGGFAVDDFDALVGAAVVAVAVCARVGGSIGDADALDRHDEWSVIQTKKLAAASLHVNKLQYNVCTHPASQSAFPPAQSMVP